MSGCLGGFKVILSLPRLVFILQLGKHEHGVDVPLLGRRYSHIVTEKVAQILVRVAWGREVLALERHRGKGEYALPAVHDAISVVLQHKR